MTTAIKLTAAITLTFVALAIAFVNLSGVGAVWISVPPLLIFGTLFLFLRHRERHSRPFHAPRLFWSMVLVASMAAWALYFGCIVPPYVVGIDGPPPITQSFLERPWLVHRIYLGLFRGLGMGGANSIAAAAVILLSLLLPTLVINAVTQLRHPCSPSASNDD